MKKEDLIELGIDEEVAKQVMALHGKTVTTLNSQVSTLEAERDNLQEQVATNQSELDKLKEAAQGNEELTKQLAELQTKFDQVKSDSELNLAEQQKDFAIRMALKDVKPFDENDILEKLNKDTIQVVGGKLQGFEEQLKDLQENKSYLFQQEETPAQPRAVAGGNPQGSTNEIEDAFDAKLAKYN